MEAQSEFLKLGGVSRNSGVDQKFWEANSGDVETIPMLFPSQECFDPWTQKWLENEEMLILILLNLDYRKISAVGTPSIWYVEWFWTKTLVQVSEVWSLCDKLHFCVILKCDVFGLIPITLTVYTSHFECVWVIVCKVWPMVWQMTKFVLEVENDGTWRVILFKACKLRFFVVWTNSKH